MIRRMGLLPVEEDRVGHRLLAEEDVLGDRQDRDEHEVLVDHADAARDGVRWAGDLDRLAVEAGSRPRPGVASPYRMFMRVDLPGAVLAEQGVDLAGADVEVDGVVRDDARIALGDPAHLRAGARRLGHGALGRSARSEGGRADSRVR